MADTINKPSIQIRNGLPSPLSDKSPSPATKLLISHGKPNFTIARSPKVEDNGNPLSPQPNANNNYNPYKCANNNSSNSNINSNKFVVGTKFNGVFKPSTAAASWATNSNGNGNSSSEQNEAAKVVLRRPKLAEAVEAPAAAEDENVPEFIRRQRRIQERLAKENVLDFENRRSGYFTHVMISPDSPNRTSFVETMASPAIVPALEMPLPAKIEEEQTQQQQEQKQEQPVVQSAPVANGHSEQLETQAEPAALLTNGHSVEQSEVQPLSNGHAHDEDVAPEDVAKAIEEVNKAVAGEDDDSKTEVEQVAKAEVEVAVAAAAAALESAPAAVEAQVEVITPAAAVSAQNGDATAVAATNGHDEAITISHTNGHASDVPSLATPDPSGALGVNYEPKTVVSFAQELGSGENNYPDTVKVTKESAASSADAQLQELTKLKFDIQNDAQNEVQVTPVLRAD
ncbi:uncharacterized protein hebe isoform X1 [Drosophila virilis]|uniref:Uncharacterized protein, isoform A n=1 Tax=Drosophila virilis TaxID=7244 RepID=B4LJC0_DROVI|nr:uncharacterized protein LOC6626744 [Drosophila virilis]XP_015029480.1 uncharacterized protein LOC6626744 [Drosophila virilis]EDW60500.1 uncharacterized protein Dvir_GJ20827, isoform A [Drosophila virilis]KRF79447.1 uncharacterized protein Dvir_GJ20827, isoform B [Drosophila virilis]KRF79448.1 uncharacterized protein Dvir_GJ20827, isoform C [Drosophila virilis]